MGITDGISADLIARTPDKNIGEVLKRVSGVGTVDNKYMVVRGLGERYNSAMLNGQMNENFVSFSAGGSVNDLTTGKPFQTLQLEGREYFGKAASHRNLFGKLDWNSSQEILQYRYP